MKILLASDGSDHSRRASELLARLAGRKPHQVTVLHVAPRPFHPHVAGGGDAARMIRETGLRAAASLAASLSAGLRRGRRLSSRPAVDESWNAADAVLKRAGKEKSGLIVLGARGLTPLKSFFLGSVSQKVLTHARAPVLITRGALPRGAPRVVAAVDGSASARRALSFLVALGLPRRSKVSVLHVVRHPMSPWVPELGPFGGGPVAVPAILPETLATLKRRGTRVLAQARLRLSGAFDRVETTLVEGYPPEEIIRAARARSADLIVIGRRGLTRLDRFLLGSVSQKVSVYAGCSVLVVR